MKKYLVIALIVLLSLAGSGFLFLRNQRPAEPEGLHEPVGKLIETSLEERPYVTLTPSSDGHWLTVNVSRIKNASSLDYELLYNTASGASQGSISSFNLQGKTSYSKKILLGSESSGNYKYDKGVTEGSLTIKLRSSQGVRKFVSEFHLQQGEKELTSIDGHFSFEGKLGSAFYLTMSTIGLPGEIEGQGLAGPYGIFTSGNSVVKNATVKLKPSEEKANAKLYSWTGKAWQEEDEATVATLTTFMVISPEE